MEKEKIKNKGIKKSIVTIIFAGLLTLPAFLQTSQRDDPEIKLTQKEKESSLKKYGLYFEDVTSSSGVDFIHHSPQLDKKLDPILPQIASMGASIAVCDFDKDGWSDFYTTNSRTGYSNALFHNNKDGTFKDVATQMGVANVNQKGTGVSMGAVWGDYDNEGYEDLFVYKWGKCELFKNEGGTNFKNVTENSGIPGWINANTAIWVDYNNDGLLDLFIGCYYPENIDLWHLKSTVIMPESFEYANNGGRNYLLRNNGNGTFTDVTFQMGLKSTKWTLAAGAMDINRDGYQDLIVANDYSVDEIFLNQGGKFFKEIGRDAGIGYSPKSGMNVSFGDVDNSGRLGIYISNITAMGVLLQGNNFWIPSKKGKDLVFENEAREKGVELGGWSYGTQFGDLNNDGSQDIYCANGYISGVKGTSYWYDYSKVTGGNKSIISDVKNWPAMKGRSQSGYEENIIWLNDGAGNFQDVTENISPRFSYDSRSVAFADLWNRGVLDILVSSQNNKVIILKNIVNPDNNWIEFALNGIKSNKNGIGAIVDLYWGGKMQSQVLTAGIGFCSENQRRLHFGIGNSKSVEKVVIHWPSGITQTIDNPAINKLMQVNEAI